MTTENKENELKYTYSLLNICSAILERVGIQTYCIEDFTMCVDADDLKQLMGSQEAPPPGPFRPRRQVLGTPRADGTYVVDVWDAVYILSGCEPDAHVAIRAISAFVEHLRYNASQCFLPTANGEGIVTLTDEEKRRYLDPIFAEVVWS